MAYNVPNSSSDLRMPVVDRQFDLFEINSNGSINRDVIAAQNALLPEFWPAVQKGLIFR